MAEFGSIRHNKGSKEATHSHLKKSDKKTSEVKFNFPRGGTVKVALKTIRFLSGLMSKAFGKGKPLYDFKINKVEAQTKIQSQKDFKQNMGAIRHHLKELGYTDKSLRHQIDNIRNLPVADQMEALYDTPNSEDYFLGYSSKKDAIEDKQVAFKTLKDIGYSEKATEKLFLLTKTNSKDFNFRSTLYKMLASETRKYQNNSNQDHSSSANLSVDNGVVSMDIQGGRVFYNKSENNKKSSLVQTKDQHSTEATKNQDSKVPQKKSKPADISSHSTSVDNGVVSMDIQGGRVTYKK